MSEHGKDIIRGLKEAIAYEKGKLKESDGVKAYRYRVPSPNEIDVRAIRLNLNMTQEEFSIFGFSKSAIRHWENDRRTPDGAARVLLKVIEEHPDVVLETLKDERTSGQHGT